jgi:LuxR family maltose regulon positive regulatory protein
MVIAKGIEVECAGKFLTALEDEQKSISSGGISEVDLAEPLSQREKEVLRLLVTDLTTPEIAGEMIVSVSTVRSHIKNIYAKLGVHSRYEAVTKARELGIL